MIDKRTTRRLVAVIGALALLTLTASCGGAANSYTDDRDIEPERDDPVELSEQQQADELALFEALSQTEPACEQACELRSRICELGDRICAIADRHPSDTSTAERCDSAEASCARSSARVEERCGC